jgi:hypothetical protein
MGGGATPNQGWRGQGGTWLNPRDMSHVADAAVHPASLNDRNL